MTEPMKPSVTQADRDAAATMHRWYNGQETAAEQWMRDGRYDDDDRVLAFARHREAHTRPPASDTARPSEPDESQYLIRKGGYYYRPNCQGYTTNIAEAGRYTLAEAIKESHPNGPDGPRDGMSYEVAPPIVSDSTGDALRGEIERLLGVYSHNLAMNVCGGYENGKMIRDSFVDDLVALASEPVAGWLSMVSAPRDGTRILVCWDGDENLSPHVELGKFKSGLGWCNTYGKSFHGEPDRYMELPDPRAALSQPSPDEGAGKPFTRAVIAELDRDLAAADKDGAVIIFSTNQARQILGLLRATLTPSPDDSLGRLRDADWLNLMPREIVARAALNEGCREQTAAEIRGGSHRFVKISAEVAVKLVGFIQEQAREALSLSTNSKGSRGGQ